MSTVRTLALLILTAALGVLTGRYGCQPATVTIPVTVSDVKTVLVPIGPLLGGAPAAATGPAPVGSAAATRPHLRPAERFLAKLVRHRVSERLQRDGFALVGRDPTPLKPERAAELLAQVDDEQIVSAARSVGGEELAGGKVLDRLGALLDWLAAHQDQILEVVKFVMALLALFGLGPPAAG